MSHRKALPFLSSALLVTATLIAPASAADLVIDDFIDALPDQALPNINFPGIFIGTIDGVTHTSDAAQQDGLSGVLGGQRDTDLLGFGVGPNGGQSLSSLVGSSLMSYNSAFGTTAILTVKYGARNSLDLDVSFGEAITLRGLNGDLDDSNPVRPVPFTVTLTSGAGQPLEVSQSATIILIADGDYELDFALFPAIDFADLDTIAIEFDGTAVQAIDFAFDSVGIRGPQPSVDTFCTGSAGTNLQGGVVCPCGNDGNPGEGCANGSGVGGLLSATGVPSIANDTLVLSATQIPGNTPGMFLAGTSTTGNGSGVPFGNGLLCISNTVRLNKVDGGGFIPLDGAPGLAQTLNVSPGDTTYFQYWYRNPGGPCGSRVNSTNGLQVTWGL